MNRRPYSKNLIRKQLDSEFSQERKKTYKNPKGGWIRMIRESLEISKTQLAKKLGITKQTIGLIESSEEKGTITFSTFKKVADALNCELRVSLVPRESLEKMIRNRAMA